MKSSRFRGAALAWGALLASGTVYSQAPYSAGPMPYGYPQPQQYYSAPSQQPFYSLPAVAPPPNLPLYSQPAAPVNLSGQMSLVSETPMSVLATPVHGPPGQGETVAPGIQSGGQIQAPPAQGFQGGQGQQFPGQNYYYGYGQSPYGAPNNGPIYSGDGANYGGPGMSGGGYGMGTGAMGYGGMGSGVMSYGGMGSGAMGYGGMGAGAGMGYGVGGGYGAGVGVGYGDAYGAGYGFGYDGGYGCGYVPRQPRWYIGAYGLWLTRDDYANYTFSYDSSNEAVQYTNARDVNANWDGGFAIAIGHYFNCGCNAIEFVYWGWHPDDVATYTYESQVNGSLNGIFNWNSLDYDGQIANVWVDDARVHALWRQTEVNNFELNILQFGGGGCGRFQYSFLGGGRIFVYEDMLTFGSETTDDFFDGDDSELFYQINVRNKLYGFQLGGVGSYCVTPRFVLNGGTKYGVFVNKIAHQSLIGGGGGLAIINNGPNGGQEWIVQSSKEDISFLGEVFVGASYCLTPRWSLSGGYRAIAVTGIAEPSGQIYPDLRGINDAYSIESDSSMILHGAYFGAQFCW